MGVKTWHWNCGQTVADGATLWSVRRCEIIVVANTPKYWVDSRYKVCRLKIGSTSAALVPQYVGFSCFTQHASNPRRTLYGNSASQIMCPFQPYGVQWLNPYIICQNFAKMYVGAWAQSWRNTQNRVNKIQGKNDIHQRWIGAISKYQKLKIFL